MEWKSKKNAKIFASEVKQRRHRTPEFANVIVAGGLLEVFDRLYRPERLSVASYQTVYQYRLTVRRFSQFLGRPAMIEDLTDEQVGKAAAWVMGERGLSQTSASKFRDTLVAIWSFLHRKKLISHLPELPTIPEPHRIPVAFTEAELRQLWEYLKRMPGDLNGVPANYWFMTLIAVLWDTGERIGAILETGWDQIDLEGGWITITAECRKGGLADTLSRLHPETVDLLKHITLPSRDRVWPWPYSDGYLWTKWGEIMERAGLPNDRDHKFHCIRKSVATHVAAAGGDAQRVMGHTTPHITLAAYIDPRATGEQFPADMLFRPDRQNGGAR